MKCKSFILVRSRIHEEMVKCVCVCVCVYLLEKEGHKSKTYRKLINLSLH
jgi:hypothetical protein